MIRTVIVDDSAVVRAILRKILSKPPLIEVVGEAGSGEELLKNINKWKPDVITLDINMPGMSGLEVLPILKNKCPECKVIMISALTREGADETIEALNRGAIDFIPKPKSYSSIFDFEKHIVEKIIAANSTKSGFKHISRSDKVSYDFPEFVRRGSASFPIVAIGVSTGGPPTLNKVLPKLNRNFPAPILIAIHMPDTFTDSFAKHLNEKCSLFVKEAEDGEKLEKGTIYISRGRINMKVTGKPPNVYIRYEEPKNQIYVPSVDSLFCSVADAYREGAIGVVMTGMGNDGSEGIVEIKKRGGVTIAEDPKTAILWAMPQSAVDTGYVDYIVPAENIPPLLEKLIEGYMVKGGRNGYERN